MIRALGLSVLSLALFASANATLPTWPAGETVYRLKQGSNGFTGWEDTFINSSGADSAKNFGGDDTLWVSSPAFAGTWHPKQNEILWQVNFGSMVPDNFVATMATLYYYVAKGASGTNSTDTLATHRVYYDWAEGNGAGAASTSTATWHTANSADNWISAGCTATGLAAFGIHWVSVDSTVGSAFSGADSINLTSTADIVGDPISIARAKTLASASGQKGWICFDVTRQANLWLHGGNINNGAIIKTHANTQNRQWGLISSEHPDTTYRPFLVLRGYAISHDTTVVSSGGGGWTPLGLGGH